MVDFHRRIASGNRLSPPGGTFTLSAAIEHLLWRTVTKQSVKDHDGGEFLDALRTTHWPEACAQDLASDGLRVRIIPQAYELVWLRSTEADLRSEIASAGFTTVTAKALTGAVSEMINNVWQHANSQAPGLLAYQLEPQRVHIAIADNGVGVLVSLRTNPQHASLRTSMAALKAAMRVGVSRYTEPAHGYGFDTMLRAVADQWGAVRLRTGQAVLEFHASTDVRDTIASYGVDLPGLQITFSCGTTPPTARITL